ncbi:RNA-binding protein YlmH, contains S4-like domain [Paenibacillaceae bacterium GAS479]|nr:RNA-binding protein YlmH, contains S4-like domain [Paenibacillaceae bacterium GAS479]
MSGFFEHFLPEERPFVDRVLEWVERSAGLHELKRTDFLDPRQQSILQSLANREPSITIRLDGGYEGAERRRALIAPEYRYLEAEDMSIVVLEVEAPSGGHPDLDHGDYLGSVLGLGIKRDRIGDIHVGEEGAQLLVAAEIAEFLNIHLRQVHRLNVMTAIRPLSELRPVTATMEEMAFTVASMRLDGIASDVYRISRAKIVDPIRAGRCRVNWKAEEDPSKQLREGDVVSIKGLGRFKLLEVDGVTKKGRIRVRAGKFV